MAINYFYEFTPKTARYIDLLNDNDRVGHHNHLIEQKYLNGDQAVSSMSKVQLQKFDRECLKHLLWLDLPKQNYDRKDIILYTKSFLKHLGKKSKALDNIDTLYFQQSFGYCHHALYSALYDYFVK